MKKSYSYLSLNNKKYKHPSIFFLLLIVFALPQKGFAQFKADTFTIVKAVQQAQGVVIKWSVQYELNIQSYQVQKSTDSINFNTVDSIVAKGELPCVYNWLDSKIVLGNNYYRIVSVTTDGSLNYSLAVESYINSVAKSGAIDY